MKKFLTILIVGFMLMFVFVSCGSEKDDKKVEEKKKKKKKKKKTTTTTEEELDEKPVIYLYSNTVKDVFVSLDYDGRLTCTYPEYDNGWEVSVMPDGTITDKKTGKVYSYLFWEGVSKAEYDMSEGFVVAGEDTGKFLEEKLTYMGLNARERNDFITYWLPRMQDNRYNLISFQGKEYTDSAVLNVEPTPDSMLRVFMVFKGLDEMVEVEEQELSRFERSLGEGLTVIEWGGSEMN